MYMADLIAACFFPYPSPQTKRLYPSCYVCSLAGSLAYALSAYKCIISMELEMYCSFLGCNTFFWLTALFVCFFFGRECSSDVYGINSRILDCSVFFCALKWQQDNATLYLSLYIQMKWIIINAHMQGPPSLARILWQTKMNWCGWLNAVYLLMA